MKYPFLFFYCLAFSMAGTQFALGQETEKVNLKHKNPNAREVFYVIKGTNIKHGEYKKILRGMMGIEEKGQYENGEKTGVWEYFDAKGEVEMQYDFSNNELVYNKNEVKPASAAENSAIIIDGTLRENNTGRLPLLFGGMSKHLYYLVNNMQYPPKARAAKAEGTVIISVTITKNGRIIDEKIEGEVGYGLDEEALRVIQLLPDEWIPLYYNGQAVDTRLYIPVNFKLS